MNKKVALISSFCDDQEKLDVLNENIKKLKAHDLDVILVSSLALPKETVKLCDYIFYTKENPVLTWPVKVQIYYAWFIFGEENRIKFYYPSYDYGWSGLNHIKKLTQIALTFNYDYFYNLIYDLDIDENVIGILNNPEDALACGFERDNIPLKLTSLHFMVFNRQKAKKLHELITLENYLNFLNSSDLKEGKDAEGFFETLGGELEYRIADFYTKDKITVRRNDSNHSKIDGVKLFIEKNTQNLESEIRVCVYENKNKSKIEMVVNGKSIYIDEIFKIYPLGLSFWDIESMFFKVSDQTEDLMPVLKSIPYSYMELEKIKK
jgi:hypothetical protein